MILPLRSNVRALEMFRCEGQIFERQLSMVIDSPEVLPLCGSGEVVAYHQMHNMLVLLFRRKSITELTKRI